MTTKKILILGISLLQLINSSQCWPNFFYYGRQSNQVYNLSSTDSLKNTEFNYSWPTILIVHGFGSHAFEPFLIQMKDKFHKHVEINTIMVDWKQGAIASNNFVLKALYYIIAITNLRTLGQGSSVFIQTNRIDPDTITCVGHSLGAHGCGFIAKAYYSHTRRRLSRISGLDPAGPLFQLFQIAFPARYRLDSDDAAFVDCIFTSTYSGIILPICKANFYPNALNGQPQCETNDDNCEHGAAVYFYIESIAGSPTCTFSAAQCVNYQLTCSLCTGVFPNNNEKMGFYTPNYTRGIFLLNTKPTPPYCLN